jgi:hypothetical protein
MPPRSILKLLLTLLLSFYFFTYAFGDPYHTLANWNFIDNVDLIIHEAGHFIFMFFGEFMHVLGGSLTQVVVPLLFVGYFILQRQWFSASVVLFWVGQNIISVATYLGDALVQQLPLLGGDGVMHDWNYLLSTTGLLRYTDMLGRVLHGVGFTVIIVAVIGCLWYSFSDEVRKKIGVFLMQ